MFDIISGCFPYFHDLILLLEGIESIYHHFSGFIVVFLSSWENLHMIFHDSDLFYVIYIQQISPIEDKITNFVGVLTQFDIFKEVFRKRLW